MPAPTLSRLDRLTFKANLREARYGWLRLTPAYSVHLVSELLDREAAPGDVVLDPFCGTGTTALVCAERGIEADTTDINPFLLWLAKAKSAVYADSCLDELSGIAQRIDQAILDEKAKDAWIPPIHQIEKWWSERALRALGRAMSALREEERTASTACVDLAKIAFCRAMIEHAKVSFGHQSMSFRASGDEQESVSAHLDVARAFRDAVQSLTVSARSTIERVPNVIPLDARDLRKGLPVDRYHLVITSPPYPNRMSYIRELRPYMYWLGYLADRSEAGVLDWKAIGGTWGVATSNVAKWSPEESAVVPHDGFAYIVSRISERSDVLGKYVSKYFHDMVFHIASLFAVMRSGGRAHYVVGNSKFYDVMLPVEDIFASLFRASGFVDVTIETIRKRSSKRELFEFTVSAKKP